MVSRCLATSVARALHSAVESDARAADLHDSCVELEVVFDRQRDEGHTGARAESNVSSAQKTLLYSILYLLRFEKKRFSDVSK